MQWITLAINYGISTHTQPLIDGATIEHIQAIHLHEIFHKRKTLPIGN